MNYFTEMQRETNYQNLFYKIKKDFVSSRSRDIFSQTLYALLFQSSLVSRGRSGARVFEAGRVRARQMNFWGVSGSPGGVGTQFSGRDNA